MCIGIRILFVRLKFENEFLKTFATMATGSGRSIHCVTQSVQLKFQLIRGRNYIIQINEWRCSLGQLAKRKHATTTTTTNHSLVSAAATLIYGNHGLQNTTRTAQHSYIVRGPIHSSSVSFFFLSFSSEADSMRFPLELFFIMFIEVFAVPIRTSFRSYRIIVV